MSLRSAFAVAFLAASLLRPSIASAQGAKENGVKVRIPTADGVTLQGTFYPAKNAQGKVPPTVLLVPSFGEKSTKPEWINLAETLQEQFAVMTFDFRGHGDSTEIEPTKFWRQGMNQQLVKGYKGMKETIDYKEFSQQYLPALCNDLAAVKSFLDRKNDQGQCNTSTFMIVASETGASIASLWIHSENFRYRMTANAMFPLAPPTVGPDAVPEGRNVVACVWLSISPTIGSHKVALSKLLETTGKTHATPMAFMYGEEDAKSRDLARNVVRVLKTGVKDKEKYGFTDAVAVGKTKLAGVGLLAKSLETDVAIRTYLSEVVKKKNNEWLEKDQRKAVYCWRFGLGSPPTIIKPAEEQNIVFDTYEKFLPR